ncbi:MAG: type II restriction endonuclease [Chloroflexi bacterium]|nr:type II restriction endonuclease [Chloroflexota bacterium]
MSLGPATLTRVDRVEALAGWFERVAAPEWRWIIKRLSANDTGATGAHQVGIYVPRDFALSAFPALTAKELNPRVPLRYELTSHDQTANPNLIYYNNRPIAGGTRDEARITGFGGSASSLQDAENTGAIVLFALRATPTGGELVAWLSSSLEEDDDIETRVGPLVPGAVLLREPGPRGVATLTEIAPHVQGDCACDLAATELPPGWSTGYPSGESLRDEAVRRCRADGQSPDIRLLQRHRCEHALYKSIESAIETRRVAAGFPDLETFMSLAHTIANRRKSRAGRSLELQVERILEEESIGFERGAPDEDGNRLDFVFPSGSAYKDAASGDPSVHFLSAKRTLKERWSQVLKEGKKVPTRHLLTLDEGVSEGQFALMQRAGLQLVVPAPNVAKFPPNIRTRLLTFEGFLARVR